MNDIAILIGGPPGVGKTTLGRAIAARLDRPSVTADDLLVAARAVTTPASHPGLHIPPRGGHLSYFTETPPERVIEDAEAHQHAMWPVLEAFIRRRAATGSPVVLDGWHLRPDLVASLDLPVRPVWLTIDPSVLEARERAQSTFFDASSDPSRMFRTFMARSLGWNDAISALASRHGGMVLHQSGDVSVDELIDAVLDA